MWARRANKAVAPVVIVSSYRKQLTCSVLTHIGLGKTDSKRCPEGRDEASSHDGFRFGAVPPR